MANHNVQVNEQISVSAEYKMDTKEPQTEIVTSWFKIEVPGYEWTDIYLGLSKKSGEWLSASNTFYDLGNDIRTKALSEASALLHKLN